MDEHEFTQSKQQSEMAPVILLRDSPFSTLGPATAPAPYGTFPPSVGVPALDGVPLRVEMTPTGNI